MLMILKPARGRFGVVYMGCMDATMYLLKYLYSYLNNLGIRSQIHRTKTSLILS